MKLACQGRITFRRAVSLTYMANSLINAVRLTTCGRCPHRKRTGRTPHRLDRRPTADYEKARLATQQPLRVSGFVLTNPEIEKKVSGSVLADPEVSSDTLHTPVTGFITPFAAAEQGWDREEVIDASMSLSSWVVLLPSLTSAAGMREIEGLKPSPGSTRLPRHSLGCRHT